MKSAGSLDETPAEIGNAGFYFFNVRTGLLLDILSRPGAVALSESWMVVDRFNQLAPN
jgi:hypothetical protein